LITLGNQTFISCAVSGKMGSDRSSDVFGQVHRPKIEPQGQLCGQSRHCHP